MRFLLGVELNSRLFSKNSRACRICYLVTLSLLGFLLLTISISANTYSLIDTINSVYPNPSPPLKMLSTANLFIIAITAINDAFFNVAIHLIFFAFVILTNKWKSLWSTLLQLQFQMPKFDRDLYFRCRKIALAGMFLILVVKLSIHVLVTFKFNDYLSSIQFRILAWTFTWLSVIFYLLPWW